MAKLRKFSSYQSLERPYTRISKFSAKNFVRGGFPALKITKFDMGNAKHLLEFFESVGHILGIMPHDLQKLPKTIDMIVDQRERARQSKDFVMADKLRTQIEEAGYKIDDTTYGPLVKKL